MLWAREPNNINRTEGETDVFISCPFEFRSTPSVWRINGTDYTSATLPSPPFELNSNGLFIDMAHQCLNQTSFQCIDTSTDDLRGQESKIGVLTVTKPNPHSNLMSGIISYPIVHV